MPTHRYPKSLRLAGTAALAVALILAVAGCGGSGHSHAAARSSTTSTSVPSRTTRPSPTTATSPSTRPGTSSTTVQGPSGPPADYPAAQTDPPSLAGAYPTGSTVDLVTVIKTLTTYEDWVWSHPDPALVANYELATGNAYAGEVKDIRQFQQEGLHAAPTPAEIDYVKVTRQATPQPPQSDGQPRQVNGYQWFLGGVVTVVYNLAPIPMYEADGKPSSESFNPSHPGPTAFVVSLVQGSDGQFRINDTNQFNPAGGIRALEQGR